MKSITLPVTGFADSMHAGEFTSEGRLYCAAHVPTIKGFEWELEVKNAPLNVDGGWEKVSAKFTLNRRNSTLTVSF